MQTKYSSLVNLKKKITQKSESVLKTANSNLNSAMKVLETSCSELNGIITPKSGKISEFLSIRTLLDSQRAIIKHNEEWVKFAQEETNHAKEQLKLDMIEFEKFNYLELQEIKEMLKKIHMKETKELDEIALMTYDKKIDKR